MRFVGGGFAPPPPPAAVAALTTPGEAPVPADRLTEWWNMVSPGDREVVERAAKEDPVHAALLLRYLVLMQRTDATFDEVAPFLDRVERYRPQTIEGGAAADGGVAQFRAVAYAAWLGNLWLRSGPYPEHADRLAAAMLHLA